jgi:hypothetical protein
MNDSMNRFDPLRGVSTAARVVVKFREHLRPAIVSLISLSLLTGLVFPLVRGLSEDVFA